jgi:hypothetical protein
LTAPIGKGWHVADFYGGWTCQVDQGRYGHVARKSTWLYAVGVELPSLDWRPIRETAMVSWCGNKIKSGEVRPRVGKTAASATPLEFREILIAMARQSTNTETARATE